MCVNFPHLLFLLTTTAPKPRCSTHTGLLRASSFLSGLRSEHSSSPRLTLAGSSVNYAEQHTRNTARSLICPKILFGGEARVCAALGHAAGTGRGVRVLLCGHAIRHRSPAHSSLSRVLVPALAHGGNKRRSNRTAAGKDGRIRVLNQT